MGSLTQVLRLQPVPCLKVIADLSVVPIWRANHMDSLWLSGTCIIKKKIICTEQTEAMQESCVNPVASGPAINPLQSWGGEVMAGSPTEPAHDEYCRSLMKA